MKNIKNIIRKRFPYMDFDKIILFKNPNECNSMYIEKTNPTHVGILWAKRKKSLGKGCHYIKIGKVYFRSLYFAFVLSVIGWFDAFTQYSYNVLLSTAVITLFVCSFTTILFYISIYWSVSNEGVKVPVVR